MKDRKFLNTNEIERLSIALAPGKNRIRNRCILLMCFIHGLRVSELCNLRLQDIQMASNRLNVCRLKNGFSTQHPIQPRERVALKQWLEIRDNYLDSDSEWLFLSSVGGQVSRQQVYRIMREAGESAGISVRVHPHMLRHACGYALADQGIDTRLIQDYLGHRNIQNTVIYTASNVERFRHIDI